MTNKSNFFSRQDIGGEEPEKFRLHLQIANLKREKAELLEALESTRALNLHLHEEGTIGHRVYSQIQNAIKKATL